MEKNWGITKVFNGGIESWHGKGENSELLQSIFDLDVERLKKVISEGKDLNGEITYTKDDVKISGTPLYYLLSTKPIEPEKRKVSTELPVEKIHRGLLHTTSIQTISTKDDLIKAEKNNLERTAKIIEMAELLLDNGAIFKTSDKNFKTKIKGLESFVERIR